jgi:hypothetical protein
MPAIQGYLGLIRSNQLNLTASRWSIDWRLDVFDATNFDIDIPFGHYVTGLADADVSAECFYETADDPFSDGGRALVAGTQVDMRLTLDVTGLGTNLMMHLPTVLLTSVRTDTPVRDVIRVSVTGRFTSYRLHTAARTQPTLPTSHS